MHYTGTIWRPPYEASSLLLEVTAGCTHHKCKFCTLYADLPFDFRMTPLADIEDDLLEVQMLHYNPASQITARLRGIPTPQPIQRVFLTGANPFAMGTKHLLKIADLIHTYLPSVTSIGCFARITDSMNKTDEDLLQLHQAGYNRLTIGMETGDDDALAFMNKGYCSTDIITQCQRLEKANMEYGFFYLTGISGKDRGITGAKATANVINQLHPFLVGPNMLTVYPNSKLYQEIQLGHWAEESETEKYQEMKALLQNLIIPTTFAAMGASNAFQLHGILPRDKEKLLGQIDKIIADTSESQLQQYRERLPHL